MAATLERGDIPWWGEVSCTGYLKQCSLFSDSTSGLTVTHMLPKQANNKWLKPQASQGSDQHKWPPSSEPLCERLRTHQLPQPTLLSATSPEWPNLDVSTTLRIYCHSTGLLSRMLFIHQIHDYFSWTSCKEIMRNSPKNLTLSKFVFLNTLYTSVLQKDKFSLAAGKLTAIKCHFYLSIDSWHNYFWFLKKINIFT